MNLFNAFVVGFKEIWAHKFRSMLTMLGIILGVSSLIGMSALVKGMENGMREALVAVGGIEKVRLDDKDIPQYQQHRADQAVGCTMNDVYALEKSAPLIKMVTPEMRLRGATASYGEKNFDIWNFVGTWPNALEMNQHVVEYGRMFNEVDDQNARNVCVVGVDLRDELFGTEENLGHEYNPVGRTINIKGMPFTIIGMFERYESERAKKERALAKLNPPNPAQNKRPGTQPWLGRARVQRRFRLHVEECNRLHSVEHDVGEIPRLVRFQQHSRPAPHDLVRESGGRESFRRSDSAGAKCFDAHA